MDEAKCEVIQGKHVLPLHPGGGDDGDGDDGYDGGHLHGKPASRLGFYRSQDKQPTWSHKN